MQPVEANWARLKMEKDIQSPWVFRSPARRGSRPLDLTSGVVSQAAGLEAKRWVCASSDLSADFGLTTSHCETLAGGGVGQRRPGFTSSLGAGQSLPAFSLLIESSALKHCKTRLSLK